MSLELKATGGVDVYELDGLLEEENSHISSQLSINSSFISTKYSVSNSLDDENLDTDSADNVIEYLSHHVEGNLWLDCQEVPLEDIERITKVAFGGLHPLTLELLNSNSHRDTLQEVQNYIFCSLGSNTAIIVFNRGIISISHEKSDFRGGIKRRLKRSLPHSREWICYALVDKMTRLIMPVAAQIDMDANWINEHVYVAYEDVDSQSVLDRLGETRSKAVHLTVQIRARLEVIEAVGRRWADHEVVHYFENVKDSLVTLKHRLEAHESLLGNTHRNWMAVTQMSLEKKKNNVLVIVGQFLALTTVFLPMLTIYTTGHMELSGPGMTGNSKSLTDWGIIQGITLTVAIIVVYSLGRYFKSIMKRPAPSLTEL